LQERSVDGRVAGLFEQSPYDLGALENAATTASFEEFDHVTEVVEGPETETRVA
jgi:hypothetical protein